ncbi:oxidoreductase [Aureococcus anophagefferens]|nr:oxidoreductase [Aureococcus anophagefferens]
MNYQTDAQSRQKDILRKQDRGGAIDGKAMKKTLTATHFVLGNDDVKWTTNATQEDPTGRMHEFIGGTSNMRAQAKKLKAELSGHNFVLGNDVLNYSTTSATSFKYESESALAAQGTLIKEVKADLRKEHFNFGNEVVQYETDAQRSMKNGEITPARLGEMKHDAKAAQDLKIKLLATSVVIGDDPTYMR